MGDLFVHLLRKGDMTPGLSNKEIDSHEFLISNNNMPN
jgi:hypothetical protein